jgi:hypothetical protein
MDDAALAATCIADEASNQPYEGKVAVGIVILNRMVHRYESDGTVPGTVLKRFQFSGFWFAMEAGHYKQVEFDAAGAAAQADRLHAEFNRQPIWADCQRAWIDAQHWHQGASLSFHPGPAFAGLTHDTLMYYNPRVCAAPAWARPELQDAVIFQHTFYHVAPGGAG